jgi:curved DNA-binding protein
MRIDPGKRDHYRVLGVPRDASMREIRRAYRRLARQHHPDVSPHPGDSAYFTELTTAYEVLHDPAKRTRYDRSGYSLKAPGDPVQAPRPCWVESHPAASWVRHPARSRRGRDLRAVLELSPREAAHLAVGPLTVSAGGHSIELPAGTRPGQQIRLAGAGERGWLGGPPGDLLLTLDAPDWGGLAAAGASLLDLLLAPGTASTSNPSTPWRFTWH